MFGLFKKRSYMGWDDYRNRIDTIDDFCFMQGVRNESIKNMQGAGR